MYCDCEYFFFSEKLTKKKERLFFVITGEDNNKLRVRVENYEWLD